MPDEIPSPPLVNLGQNNTIDGTTISDVAGRDVNKNITNIYNDLGSRPATAHHQLPAPPNDFVGREGELRQLASALERVTDNTSVTCVVRGMGGKGKTTLALVLAAGLRNRFPIQLMVDLRGAQEDPLSPLLALQRLLRALLGSEARLPESQPELEGLYRSELHRLVAAGQLVLLLADDARNAAQLKPLLPPGGCAVLVTSRERFELPGGTPAIDLPDLPPAQAEQLLLALCPRIGGHAPALARCCGGLPLALRVVAGLVQKTKARPVAELVALLEDERQRLGRMRDHNADIDVDASLHLSWKLLDGNEQRLLSQLAVFAAPFSRALAEALVQLPAGADLPDLLDGLYEANLLEWDEAQFQLHALVRLFGLARLEERALVEGRYAELCTGVAKQAEAEVLAGGERMLAGLARFDALQAHVLGCWRMLLGRAGTAETDQAVLAIATAADNLVRLRVPANERLALLQASLPAAQRQEDKHGEANVLRAIGDVQQFRDEREAALASYAQALGLFRAVGAKLAALASYAQALGLFRAVGAKLGEANVLQAIGDVQQFRKDTAAALASYEAALGLYRAVGDRVGEANVLQAIGDVQQFRDEREAALASYAQALGLFRAVGAKL
nr:AAA family ATPase [Chloroflexaceae bacterium]